MKKVFPAALFCFFSAVFISAQTPSPTPPPVENEEDVVKITTSLIQVDVTVTDKNGKIVSDLKPEDFEIYENGEKQTITNFSFVSTDSGIKQSIIPSGGKNNKTAVPVPPVPLKTEQVRRTITLLVDDLGLSFESVHFVRRALKKFVDEQMQPNDLVAIIRSSGGVGALQQFTTDKRQLYAAIENIKWNALGRGGISAFAPIEATPLEQAKSAGAEVSEEDLQAERERIAQFDNFRSDIFSVGTLGAINFVVKGMNELPGRKSIILFSDGFSIVPNKDDPDRGRRTLDALRQLTEIANRASVTVYTIDARGLQTLGLSAADNTSGLSAEQVQQRVSDRSAQLFDTQEGLAYLAKETGGQSFFNNNDFNQSIDRSLEDQKGYYLIAYQPDEETFDPQKRRYNKLNVKLLRKDVNVRYRSGFFNVEDKVVAAAKKTPAQQLTSALTSPFAVNGIQLRMNTLFANSPKEGSFVQSFLHIKADDLSFTNEPDGSHKATFDVLAIGFGANGEAIDRINKNYTITVKGESYENILKTGFVYNFLFPIKKPGAYQMRVAIRDSVSEKVGSAGQFIEVPDLKKGKVTAGGIVLENLTEKQWREMSAGKEVTDSNPLNDTSLRRFKRGTILRYGAEVYNAKFDAAKNPNLEVQIKVFRDGKLLLDGKPSRYNFPQNEAANKLSIIGALNLGDEIPVGDYVLQVIVYDRLAKTKNQLATQWVQFEVVN